MANLIMVQDRKYGDCIEKVDEQSKARDKGPPLFGLMVFKSSIMPRMILGGKMKQNLLLMKEHCGARSTKQGRISKK